MIKFYLKNYIWLLCLATVVLRLVVPQFGYIFHEKESIFLMGILFFNLLGISSKDFVSIVKKPLSLILSVLVLNGIFASLIIIYKDFLDKDVFLGLLLATTTGISFIGILFANVFNGDKSRFLLLSIITSVFSYFIISLFNTDYSFINSITDMAMFLLLPVFFAGLFNLSPYGEYIEKHGSYFSLILFLVFIYSMVSSLENLRLSLDILIYAVLFNLINIFFTYFISKNKAEKISFSGASIIRSYEITLLFSINTLNPQSSLVILTFMLVSYIFVSPVLFFVSKFK